MATFCKRLGQHLLRFVGCLLGLQDFEDVKLSIADRMHPIFDILAGKEFL